MACVNCTGRCTCGVASGDGIDIAGTGSGVDPWVVSACLSTDLGNQVQMGTDDCLYVGATPTELIAGQGVEVTGTGVFGDPYAVEACISTDANNTVEYGLDSCLYVEDTVVTSGGSILMSGNGTPALPYTPDLLLSADPCNDLGFGGDGSLFVERGGAVTGQQVTNVPAIVGVPLGAAGALVAVPGSTATSTITNPSCALSMVLLARVAWKAHATMVTTTSMTIQSEISINGGAFGALSGESFFAPTGGFQIDLDDSIVSNFGITVAPGAAFTIAYRLLLSYTGVWGAGDSASLMSVTSSLWGFTQA